MTNCTGNMEGEEEETPLLVELLYKLSSYIELGPRPPRWKSHLVAALLEKVSTIEGFKKELEEARRLNLERAFFEVVARNLMYDSVACPMFRELRTGEDMEVAYKEASEKGYVDPFIEMVIRYIEVPDGGPFENMLFFHHEEYPDFTKIPKPWVVPIYGIPPDVCMHIIELHSKCKKRSRYLKPDEWIFPELLKIKRPLKPFDADKAFEALINGHPVSTI